MSSTPPPIAPPPARAGRIAYAVFMGIDTFVAIMLCWLIYDAMTDYGVVEGDAAIWAIALLLVVAFAAGAMAAYRRGRAGLAIALAAAPAIPSLALTAAVALFLATFTHQR